MWYILLAICAVIIILIGLFILDSEQIGNIIGGLLIILAFLIEPLIIFGISYLACWGFGLTEIYGIRVVFGVFAVLFLLSLIFSERGVKNK